MKIKKVSSSFSIRHLVFLSALLCNPFANAASSTTILETCPDLKNDLSVTQWRNALIEVRKSNAFIPVESDDQVKKALDRCGLSTGPSCFSRAVGYIRKSSESYSLNVNAEVASTRIPQELFEGILEDGRQRFVLKGDVEKIAEKNGWPAVRYKSRHDGGFDETSSLLLIEIPGSSLKPPVPYDRYVNIPIPKTSGEKDTNPTPVGKIPTKIDYENDTDHKLGARITMVTIDRNQKNAQIIFQKLMRAKGSWGESPQDMAKDCYSCHPSGLRQISPLGYGVGPGETQLTEKNWKLVQKINADIEKSQLNGPANWGKSKDETSGKVKPTIDLDRFGPVYGPLTPRNHQSRTEEFFKGTNGKKGCISDRPNVWLSSRNPDIENSYTLTSSPPVDWRKVSEAMSCQNCHNGTYRGVLTERTDQSAIDFKILTDKSMPDGAHRNPIQNGGPNKPVTDELNPNERIALANCLAVEFSLEKELLNEWRSQYAMITQKRLFRLQVTLTAFSIKCETLVQILH